MRRPGPSIWLGAALLVSASAQAQDFYRYVARDGRAVYTNIVEQVPVEQRERGKLDLSRISLNSEIGAELDRRFAEQHAELSASSYCRMLFDASAQGPLRRAWEEYAPLIVCGGLLLAFLLFTPSALRRFGAPVWAKTLMMAIPSLALGGLITFTMAQTNKALAELKQRVKPCASETFAELGREPDALLRRSRLVGSLQREVARLQGAADPGSAALDERARESLGP
jgi:hypothetical protein